MSSVHAAPSQIAPHKIYTTDGTNAGLIYTSAGVARAVVAVDTQLRDMGKTVYIHNDPVNITVLRKVQIITTTNNGTDGYIYLTNVPAAQNIFGLN